jgi:hypothetical protein
LVRFGLPLERNLAMRNARLAKALLPLLAVLAGILIGCLLGKDLYPTLLNSRPGTPSQIAMEQKDLQLFLIPDDSGTCLSYEEIYTSLPPKCKTAEGELIPLPGTFPKVLMIPRGK